MASIPDIGREGNQSCPPLSGPSKWAIVAVSVGEVVGVVFIVLACTSLTNAACTAAISAGGVLVVMSTGGIVGIVITNRQIPREIPPRRFYSPGYGKETLQPINPEISELTTTYWNVHFAAFKKALQTYPEDPWSNPEVIQAADTCLKAAYTIGILTLEDLPAFTAKHGINTYAQALASQRAYLYRTFYWCSDMYRWIRFGAVWRENQLVYPQPRPDPGPYFQEGTIQSTWRTLYNTYCQKIREYVSEQELSKADPRHAKWTTPDEGEGFLPAPDTRPTPRDIVTCQPLSRKKIRVTLDNSLEGVVDLSKLEIDQNVFTLWRSADFFNEICPYLDASILQTVIVKPEVMLW